MKKLSAAGSKEMDLEDGIRVAVQFWDLTNESGAKVQPCEVSKDGRQG